MKQKIDSRIFRWERRFTNNVARLAWPIMLQNLVMAIMFIVDNLMIGKLGYDALAGVTQANRVTFLMQVTMFGVVSGASIFTAQYWGTRDVKGIHKTLGLAMMIAACVATLFAVPVLTIPDKILGLLLSSEGSEPAIEAGASYLRVVGIAYFFQAISMVQSAILKSTEQVRLPMIGSIAAIVVNVLFNYLLIFGNLGFPKLGVTGGAIATTLGCAVELSLLIGVGYRRKMSNAARLRDLHPGTREDVKKFFRVVLPTMVNEGLWAAGTVVYSACFGMMGTAVVAADSIFRNVEQIAVVALRGATHACAVMIGMSIGAGHEDEAQLTAKRMLVLGMGLGIVMGLIVFLFGPVVVNQFPVEADMPQVRDMALALINTFACVIWIQTLASLLIVGILRSGGDVIYGMVIDVLPVWVAGIPLVYLAGPVAGLPIHIVYLLTRVEELVKSGVALKRLFSGKWINNLVSERGASDQLPAG